jgi:hypothetical protein
MPARTKHPRSPAPLLTLKVSGPEVHSGRIRIPVLLTICQHAQAAVTRQAEALEGRRTLRPGPKSGRILLECTLELVGLGKGSATLGLEPAKAQPPLPEFAGLVDEAIATVTAAIGDLSKGRRSDIDPGVLDSLRHMGEVLDHGVTAVQWVVRARQGRKRIATTFDARARRRTAERLKKPMTGSIAMDGVLEMADFKPSDYRCRIHPAIGPAVGCSFKPRLADTIQGLLRRHVHIEGLATFGVQATKPESIAIETVFPVGALSGDDSEFFAGMSIEQLARAQGVEPLQNPAVLAGGWPDDEDVDEALADIYARRE